MLPILTRPVLLRTPSALATVEWSLRQWGVRELLIHDASGDARAYRVCDGHVASDVVILQPHCSTAAPLLCPCSLTVAMGWYG